ncbi:MAG: squalene/phytoene synthase family protein [Cyanobacteria bacterium]|nr:squalene/phytoene synthase family protein [Cyanobacteriota bacterium]
MTSSSIQVGASSQYQGIADDTLKDKDNGLWLSCFSKQTQGPWLQRFSWLRHLDRLAEQDQLIYPGGCQFSAFHQGWQHLLQGRQRVPACDQWNILDEIYRVWLSPDKGDHCEAELQGWTRYVEAIVDYHQPALQLQTLQDYDMMLDRLAGSCFQFLPGLHPDDRDIARYFGMVDQCYNNLRDLHEDACQGVCYFPTDLLQRFQVTLAEILDFTCFDNPGYYRLMEFWLRDYLPRLQSQALSLILSDRLPRTWQYLLAWFIHRYRRLERVMAACNYNFVQFSSIYWDVVQQDLWQYAGKHSHLLSRGLTQQYDSIRSLVLAGQCPFTAPSVLEDAGLCQPRTVG